MKCIKQTSETAQDLPAIRVSDAQAKKSTAKGVWRYASKEEWKADGRIYGNKK